MRGWICISGRRGCCASNFGRAALALRFPLAGWGVRGRAVSGSRFPCVRSRMSPWPSVAGCLKCLEMFLRACLCLLVGLESFKPGPAVAVPCVEAPFSPTGS